MKRLIHICPICGAHYPEFKKPADNAAALARYTHHLIAHVAFCLTTQRYEPKPRRRRKTTVQPPASSIPPPG